MLQIRDELRKHQRFHRKLSTPGMSSPLAMGRNIRLRSRVQAYCSVCAQTPDDKHHVEVENTHTDAIGTHETKKHY